MVGPCRSILLDAAPLPARAGQGSISGRRPVASAPASAAVRPARGRLRTLAIVLAIGSVPAGCAVVPKSRLDESHRLIQTLRSENAQLKDTALSLRSQNQDMTERAVDDERRIKLLEDSNQQLERSVMAYQDLRDQWEIHFQRIKAQVQSSVNPVSAGLLDRFESFARAHPGCQFDREAAVLTIAADRLFERGTDHLTPGALELLRDSRAVLDDPEARDLKLLVVGLGGASAVQRTSVDQPAPGTRHLSLARAARVRDQLVAEASVEASRLSVAAYELSAPENAGSEPSSKRPGRRIEIHLRPPGAPAEPAEGTDGPANRQAARQGAP